MGTAGQRCTSLRRLIVHEDVYDPLLTRLKAVYRSVSVGDPRQSETLVGPLIGAAAFENMQSALAEASASAALSREKTRSSGYIPKGRLSKRITRPAIVEMRRRPIW